MAIYTQQGCEVLIMDKLNAYMVRCVRKSDGATIDYAFSYLRADGGIAEIHTAMRDCSNITPQRIKEFLAR